MNSNLGAYNQGNIYGNVAVNNGSAHLGDQYHFSLPSHIEVVDARQRLLNSLHHPELKARLNAISEAHSETFQWIFISDSRRLYCDNFPKWLQDGGAIFLVEGNAGSGKSTFMRFLFQHPQLKTYLPRSLGTYPAIVAAHFFWLAGTKLQQSYMGLLASLACQLLTQIKTFPYEALQGCMNVLEIRGFSEWNEALLLQLVQILLCQTRSACVILIDGLDEFDHQDRPAKLMALLKVLQNHPSVRLCVSSRPTLWLHSHFSTSKRLRLRELTRQDIRTYAQSVLAEELDFYNSPLKYEEADLLEITTNKAEGVFLWVKYALHSLSEGICSLDDAILLRTRLKELPTGMEQLYRYMWQRHENYNERHRKEAASFLFCGSFARVRLLTLFELACMMDEDHLQRFLKASDPDQMHKLILRPKIEHTMQKLLVRTAGLMICQPDSKTTDRQPFDKYHKSVAMEEFESKLRYLSGVTYLHRSVHEFLWETEFGRSIVSLSLDQIHDLFRRRLAAMVAVHFYFRYASKEDFAREVCRNIAMHEGLVVCKTAELTKTYIETLKVIEQLLDVAIGMDLTSPFGVPSSQFFSSIGGANHRRTASLGQMLASERAGDFVGLLLTERAFESVKRVVYAPRVNPTYVGYLLCVAALSFLESDYLTPGVADFIKNGIAAGADLHSKHAVPFREDNGLFWPKHQRYILLSPVDLLVALFVRTFQFSKDVSFTAVTDIMLMLCDRLPSQITAWITSDCDRFKCRQDLPVLRRRHVCVHYSVNVHKLYQILQNYRSNLQINLTSESLM
ncbi:hypothetical protein H2198_008892 [Neophaeococcomyces mojaviensis]|uniref:Uncharacterized protein n=1 Tax=Neophaeococcomyces mojaviensis TaxID=3383035 RepID=A0ACC2ZW31_9EURO|nr:hypothetical protein H2198_008892 [Knufia sp. JES_112]